MLRRNIRGQTRLLNAMAKRLRSLQAVPIPFADRHPLYVDLRLDGNWGWLKDSPWRTAPDEVNEQDLIKRVVKQTDVVYDVGANLGLYTTLFSKMGCRVVAFEPNTDLLPCLRLTVGTLSNVSLVPLALTDFSGVAPFYVPNDHTMGSLADYTSAEELDEWKNQIRLTPAKSQPCQTTTLDNCVDSGLPLPDFIKCDVEGGELGVFRGAQRTLSGLNAPLVMFEVLEMCAKGFHIDKFAASEFLASLGYELFNVGAEGRLTSMIPLSQRVNVLAVPPVRRKRVLKCIGD